MICVKSVRWFFCVFAAFIILSAGIECACAATINVTASATDTLNGADGQCSLREAIANINDGAPTYADCVHTRTYGTSDRVNIPAGTYTTVSSQYSIAKNISIVGAGAGTTTINGAGKGRVFLISGNYIVSFAGVTITGGTAPGDWGGGIGMNGNGTLTVTSCTIRNNSAGSGGGISSFNNNGGTINIANCTISNNTASWDGGGTHSYATMNITNSTISNNTAVGWAGGGVMHSGNLSLTNSTITGNSAAGPGGSGIYAATLTAANSIVANQASGADCVSIAITSTSHNLESGTSCNFSGAGDLQNTNPLLSALASNGGPTQTMALQVGSPAINAGDDAICRAAPVNGVDQRGYTRGAGTHCDIGAYESGIFVNNDFEVDPDGTVPPNITGWELDFYTMNDSGTRGTGPNVVHQLNISTTRSYSGSKSLYSFLRNVGGGGGGDTDTRHATHDLISVNHFATSSDKLYLWRTAVSYTTSSRYYWRLDVELSDGTNTSTIELACVAWGNGEGCTGNYQNTSDSQATGSDGQTWYRHPIPIPAEMNRANLTIKIRHQQDSWDGTTAESSFYYDLVSAPSAKPDFNQDGKTDILWRNTATGRNMVWYMNGVTKTGYVYLSSVTDLAWTIVGTGDFNNDGKPDILWRNTSDGRIQVWFMNGVARTSYAYLPRVTDLAWTIVGTGDFNQDGKTDILWRNTTTGRNMVWYMDGVTKTGYVYLSSVTDLAWTIVGTGDFNSDGKPDILWRNTTTGRNMVWYMNGVTKTSSAYVTTNTDQAWKIVGINDYNGDGKTDILWRNTTTGKNMVWYMDGVTRTSYANVPSVDDTSWKIVSR
ncbi:MAG: FG-GAP-like repeat-containing protein [Deltaproteobacteria bacterium]